MNPRKIWTRDPLGDVENAHHIPEDAGMCLLCFGERSYQQHCPLCKGTGRQTPELVRAYVKGELNLDLLQRLA